MKYEIYFKRFASVVVEADSAVDAINTVVAMNDDEDTIGSMLDCESAWEFDYMEIIKEEK